MMYLPFAGSALGPDETIYRLGCRQIRVDTGKYETSIVSKILETSKFLYSY